VVVQGDVVIQQIRPYCRGKGVAVGAGPAAVGVGAEDEAVVAECLAEFGGAGGRVVEPEEWRVGRPGTREGRGGVHGTGPFGRQGWCCALHYWKESCAGGLALS